MASIIYEVAAEFIIESAAATIATNVLTEKVTKLSKAVDGAIFGAARLGAAYATAFLTGGGGILGVMAGAIKSSEKFRSVQIELANTMVTNGFKIGGAFATFEQSLGISDKILTNIANKAATFGISSEALAGGTKIFAAALAPKGLAGDNFSQAIELSRVVQKGAPALDIDTNQAISGAMNAIFGQVSKNSQFSRIFMESGDVIKRVSKGAITDVASFNKATAKMRIKVLIAGLDKLAGSSKVVTARAEMLSSKLMVIKDLFMGIGSIFRPIGDQLRMIIGPILDQFIKQIRTKGRVMVTLITNIMKRMGDSPKELFLTMRQVGALSGDIEKAGNAMKRIVRLMLIATAVQHVMGTDMVFGAMQKGGILGGILKFFKKITGPISKALGAITINGFLSTLGSLIVFIGRLIPLFGGLIMIFQIMSRTADLVILKWAKTVDLIGGPMIEEFDRFSNILSTLFEPFQMVIELFSDLFASFVDTNAVGFGFLNTMFDINQGMLQVAFVFHVVFSAIKSTGAAIGAFFATIMAFINNPTLAGAKDLVLNPIEAFNNNRDKDFEEFSTKLFGKDGKEKTVAKNINNNTFNNQFNIKEKIEPDRIAFTLAEQLNKLGENKRSSFGRSLSASGATR